MTHSAKHFRHLEDKVELWPPRYLAGTFCGLQCFRAQLRKHKREACIVVLGFFDFRHFHAESCSNILQRGLQISINYNTGDRTQQRTNSIRTAKSRRCNSQNVQLPSQRLPDSNAIGRTVFVKISFNIGPSLLPSMMRARATASWKSWSCRKHTLTASFSDPPRRKKAVAYSILKRSD